MMNPSGLQILLIDPDPIFRLGFQFALESFPDVHLGAQFADEWEALSFIEGGMKERVGDDKETEKPSVNFNSEPSFIPIDVIIWEFQKREQKTDFLFCERLQILAPHLPIFLLTQSEDPILLSLAKQVGIRGYCRKGTDISTVIHALRQVVGGETYGLINFPPLPPQSHPTIPAKTRSNSLLSQFFLSGLKQIDYSLTQVDSALSNPDLIRSKNLVSFWEKSVIAGQKRELLVARWIVQKFTPNPENDSPNPPNPHQSSQGNPLSLAPTDLRGNNSPLLTANNNPDNNSFISKDLQAALFDVTFKKLPSGLSNLTGIPLEIDILRYGKKQELLYIILRQIESVLDELRFSHVSLDQLAEKRSTILRDLWQNSMGEFFGKYYSITLRQRDNLPSNSQRVSPGLDPLLLMSQTIEVVPILLEDVEVVQAEILDKIPLVVDLLSYLLFGTPLVIDNSLCVVGSPEAMQRGEALLQNLVISLANAIVQPLLNRLANFEEIKQTFYDRRLISTRDIEKFRNNLSWKYRFELYLGEAQAIFESRYLLFILTDLGIEKVGIYAPRNQELERLSGVQLAVTLVLETRDAIAPRVRLVLSWLGSILVYLLTQVIGRGIGLIGRGILQGIGNAWNDGKKS